jgi:hypothetical protein
LVRRLELDKRAYVISSMKGGDRVELENHFVCLYCLPNKKMCVIFVH